MKRILAVMIGFCAMSSLWALDKVPLPKKSIAGETRQDCSVCPEMVGIPAGTFSMGSNDGDSDKKPVHSASVKEFYVSKYETTVSQFKAFVRDSGYSGSKVNNEHKVSSEYKCKEFMKPEFNQTEQDPVVCVTWEDAGAYGEWLSKKTGKTYRLPTEAEWEYAARAGSTTKYWWGDNLGNNKANCIGCGSQWDNKQTAPVGSFSPNGFGLYDTVGNVWEWTCSEDGHYLEDKQNYCNQSLKIMYRLRGGSWDFEVKYLRSFYHYSGSTTYRNANLGFRLISVP